MPARCLALLLSSVLFFSSLSASGKTHQQIPEPETHSPRQRFVCNLGYSPEQCQLQMSVLREVLDTYHAERLGNWTWVLVRSEDWRRLTEPRQLDPQSPAFSYLERRETFFEEALVAPLPARRAELMVAWSQSIDDLLRLAVTHELGHALCTEIDEFKADRNGERLRKGLDIVCSKMEPLMAMRHR